MWLDSDISVSVVQQIGDDRVIARAARRSTRRQGDDTGWERLVRALLRERHGTPFEHGLLTVEVHAPLFVARQWMRHRIGWSYSELSGRYTTLDTRFYVPPPGRPLVNEGTPLKPRMGAATERQTAVYTESVDTALRAAADAYAAMTQAGIANEVARMVLPVNTYTNFWATANPRSIMHFLALREAGDAQQEIALAAAQLAEHFATYWPVAAAAFREFGCQAP